MRFDQAVGRTLLAGTLSCSLVAWLAPAAAAAEAADAVIARAERAMGSAGVKTLRFAGSGTGATFGQAYVPGGPWPKLTISSLSRVLDYPNAALREESARSRAEPTGGGAVPLMGAGEQRQVNLLHGGYAWNLAGSNAVPSPVALEARQHDLWSSPHGVLMAARRNKATVTFDSKGGRSVAAVSFTEPGVLSAVAYIDDDGLVERVESRHPHPVSGDTAVTTLYSDYRDHGGVKFPMRIRQSHLGSTTLDLEVKEVQVNRAADIVAPDAVRNFAERVASQQVADGVWYLAGGSHHSVLIEMKDHLIVVESPLYDGRAMAMLQEAKRLVPGKPVRTVINSHHHFDHSGGLRAAAAEGATLMVTTAARPYFQKVLANPNRIKPDALARSGRKAKFASHGGKALLSDGTRKVEVYAIDGSVHAKGFTMVYLPREKLLIEADAFTPGPPNTPPPARPNENHVNLLQNIERRNLEVDRILPLHGRVVPLTELQAAVGRKP
jgi:glyoxylase-like metal-dependent hydrolase (beta-lactamase superfamily II)